MTDEFDLLDALHQVKGEVKTNPDLPPVDELSEEDEERLIQQHEKYDWYGNNYRRHRNFFAWKKDFYFDREKAQRVIDFCQKHAIHVEGELRGQPFILQPWQKKMLRTLFGWYRRSDGTRKFRTLYLEIPRKNGKSALCSVLALYLVCYDKEPASRVVSAAADREQAAIVFNVAKEMVLQNPKLKSRFGTFKRTLVHYKSGSNYQVVSADAFTKHGLNLHGFVLDEVHAQKNRELYDVLHTSMSARRQPLEIAITTAGYDKNSICWELHQQAVNVLEGNSNDESFLGIIFGAEVDADWTKEETWYKANPNLQVSKKIDYMKQECERAQSVAGYENTFKRLDLNIWTEQESRWLAIEKWDECAGEVDAEKLLGQTCYGGLDLASTTDLASFVLVFPQENGNLKILPFFWVPEEGARERAKKDKVPYLEWIRDGYIYATEGNSIDYGEIRADILHLAELFDIREIEFDRWNATQLTQQLTEDGLTMIPVTQGIATLTAPSKELERMMLDHKLEHAGNPVLRWNARNVAVIQNGEGEIRPSKKKSTEKIDGIVALIMAIDRASRDVEGESVYEEHGILQI